MSSLETDLTALGESEPVSELPEEELADTPRGGIDHDGEVPPSLDAAPEPPGDQFAGECKTIVWFQCGTINQLINQSIRNHLI